jgi:kynurenine 3-monooxygenase
MRNAHCTDLVDAVLAHTIPMHGRMIHGQKSGKLFEQAQAYDVQGRVSRLLRASTNVLRSSDSC